MTENKNQLDNQENTKKFEYEVITYDPMSPAFQMVCQWCDDHIGDSEQHLNAIGELAETIERWVSEGSDEDFGQEECDDDEE